MLEWMTDGHPGMVRLITLAPERTGAEAFVRRAAEAGIRVSLGHTSADAETDKVRQCIGHMRGYFE